MQIVTLVFRCGGSTRIACFPFNCEHSRVREHQKHRHSNIHLHLQQHKIFGCLRANLPATLVG